MYPVSEAHGAEFGAIWVLFLIPKWARQGGPKRAGFSNAFSEGRANPHSSDLRSVLRVSWKRLGGVFLDVLRCVWSGHFLDVFWRYLGVLGAEKSETATRHGTGRGGFAWPDCFLQLGLVPSPQIISS